MNFAVAIRATFIVVALSGAFSARAEGHHWSYGKHGGPAEWGELDHAFASCQLGNDPTTIDSACDTRHLVACPSDLMSDPLRVNRLLTDLLGGCTERSHRLTVTFSAGCASAFSLEPIDAPGTESASGCVAAHLAAERYACAESLDCGFGSTFLIPTR